MIFDGGRPSCQEALQGGFKGVARTSRTLHLVYAEEALKKRDSWSQKNGSKGYMSVRQVEQVIMVSGEGAVKLGTRPNKHFEGSTSGDVLLSIGAPDLMSPIETWRLTVAEKRRLLGDARTIGASNLPGQVNLEDIGDVAHRTRDDTDIEPMNFDQMVPKVYGEILHRSGAKAVIDLTCADGALAAECVAQNIPYLGVCFSAAHAEALNSRLAAVVFRKFTDEDSGMYKAKLAEMLSKEAGPNQQTNNNQCCKRKQA